jgi:beta-glucanase (GH16 family)
MLYGTVSARIKSGSLGGGIISSFIFRSSLTGDEIDYEWVGKDSTEVQSNYYWVTHFSSI